MSGRPAGTERPPVRAMLDRIREDALVTRRDYLRILVTVSGGLLAGTAAVGLGIFRRRDEVSGAPVLVARRIAPGGSARFRFPTEGDPAIAMRLSGGALVAYSSVCTHLSCTVVWNRSDERIDCPCHDGRFGPLDGRVLAGPPPRPLPKIELVERSDGIYAVGMASGTDDDA
ncbi:MAG TPA: Rieske (2Fe-2S) protein [Actinomycetota bacterium]|nr:Rieske (2Fe-2S) protein [Actinomycetota bacterium]